MNCFLRFCFDILQMNKAQRLLLQVLQGIVITLFFSYSMPSYGSTATGAILLDWYISSRACASGSQ